MLNDLDHQDGDDSASEELEHNPSGSEAKLQGKGASRGSFEDRVLAMLDGLQNNTQSVSERVSKLEGRKTQSVCPSVKGTEETRGSGASMVLSATPGPTPVSYTHLTLPTKRIV